MKIKDNSEHRIDIIIYSDWKEAGLVTLIVSGLVIGLAYLMQSLT